MSSANIFCKSVLNSSQPTLRNLDILLHPRVPPLVRSLPHVESLSLFRAEEPQEEIETREALGLETAHPDEPLSTQEDVAMGDGTASSELKVEIEVPPPRPSVLPVLTPQVDLLTSVLPRSQPQKSAIQTGAPTTLPRLPSPSFVPAPVPVDEDEDEEMPHIDLDSDSDADS